MKIKFEPKLFLFVFMALLCFIHGINAQSEKGKLCKSNEFTFPCPNEYKVILNNDEGNNFLAQNTNFGYSIFVIALKNKIKGQNFTTDAVGNFLRTLYPTESLNYRWKTLNFKANSPSSKFEVGKNLLLGFNGEQTITVEYRQISFKNKDLLVGTIVKAPFAGEWAEREFNESRYTTNGGCADAQLIVQSITGEKNSKELNFCGSSRMIIKKSN